MRLKGHEMKQTNKLHAAREEEDGTVQERKGQQETTKDWKRYRGMNGGLEGTETSRGDGKCKEKEYSGIVGRRGRKNTRTRR